MKKNILLTSASIVLLTNCSTPTSTVSGNPAEMFPAYVPSNICYLKTKRTYLMGLIPYSFNSTGTLFEGKYLVTAGHNVYDSWKSDLENIALTCKAKDGTIARASIDRQQILSTRFDKHYTSANHSFSQDYAFVALKSPIPVESSLNLPNKESFNFSEVEVAGFPGGVLRYGKGQYVKNDQLLKHTFKYTVDTTKGMSGGPVWLYHNNKSFLIGVHVSEGMAREVDSKLVERFETWKNEVM